MNSKLLFLLLLFIYYSAAAQTESENTIMRSDTWAVKGKVLPWSTLILPVSGINYTLGAEYGFGQVNSIGVDFVYNDNNSHHDYSKANHEDDSVGPSAYSVSRGIFLNYRRYVDVHKTFLQKPLEKVLDYPFLPYVSAFARYGKKDAHYDPSYITANVSADEWEYSAGVLAGFVCKYIDVNMGPFYKLTYSRSVNMVNGANVMQRDMKPSLGFRVGVNLFYVATRKSNHALAKYAAGNY